MSAPADDLRPPRCRFDGGNNDVHYRSRRYAGETACGVGNIYRPLHDVDADATCEWCIRAVDKVPT